MPTQITNFCCAIIWRMIPPRTGGKIEFLVIDSWSTDPNSGLKTQKQVKFPGGMQENGESLEQTVTREIKQETGLLATNVRKIWHLNVAPDHIKHAFMVNLEDCRGEMRTGSMNDSTDELGPPYWLDLSTLGRLLYRSHRPAYEAARKLLQP